MYNIYWYYSLRRAQNYRNSFGFPYEIQDYVINNNCGDYLLRDDGESLPIKNERVRTKSSILFLVMHVSIMTFFKMFWTMQFHGDFFNTLYAFFIW